MNKPALLSTFALAAFMGGLVGCTPSKEDQPPKPKVSSVMASLSSGPALSSPVPALEPAAQLPKLALAPPWKLEDLAGKPVSFDQFKGKVVVVDFWATWCPPCRAEIPGYIELQKKYGKDGLVIVGVSIDQGGPDVVRSFAEKIGINYQMVMADEKIADAFGGIEAVPTTFLIDRSGQIRDRKEGLEELAVYERKVAAVLAEKS